MQILQQTIDGEFVTVNFDYAAYSQEEQIFLRIKESNIKKSVDNIGAELLTVGRELLEAKERLPHGQFKLWVEQNLPFGERQAEHMMNICRDENANRYSILGFNISVQKQLAAPTTPVEVKEEIIKQAEAGQTITEQMVKEAKVKYTADSTRYCPHCLVEQVIKPKAMNNDNDVQCKACKQHHKATAWFNGSQKLLKEQELEAAKQREAKKLAKQFQTRYCPECHAEKKILVAANNFETCEGCKKLSPSEKWLTEKPQTPAPLEGQMRFCPNCGTENKMLTGYAMMGCGRCGQLYHTEKWLTEKPAPKQTTTPRYCPNCDQKQDILTTWLENETTLNKGIVKCEHCQKTAPLKTWRVEPIKPRVITWEEVESERRSQIVSELFGVSLGKLDMVLRYVQQIKEE